MWHLLELAELSKLLRGYSVDSRLLNNIGQLVSGDNAVPKPVVAFDNVTVSVHDQMSCDWL